MERLFVRGSARSLAAQKPRAYHSNISGRGTGRDRVRAKTRIAANEFAARASTRTAGATPRRDDSCSVTFTSQHDQTGGLKAVALKEPLS